MHSITSSRDVAAQAELVKAESKVCENREIITYQFRGLNPGGFKRAVDQLDSDLYGPATTRRRLRTL